MEKRKPAIGGKWGRGGPAGGEGAAPFPPPPPRALALPWMRLGPGVLNPSVPTGKTCLRARRGRSMKGLARTEQLAALVRPRREADEVAR